MPATIGSMPASQAWVKTGSITNQVRKSARLTIIMLGGACWTPIAWRRIESTVTMKGKQVTMIARPGASEEQGDQQEELDGAQAERLAVAEVDGHGLGERGTGEEDREDGEQQDERAMRSACPPRRCRCGLTRRA